MRRFGQIIKMAPEVFREGVFAINKPTGQSSAQVIRDCQQHFNPSSFFKPLVEHEVEKRRTNGSRIKPRKLKAASQVKIGHGGTLDPLATGILILGIGSATKALPQFLDCMKSYEATVVFGAATDTYDRVGRILSKRPYDHITRDKVEEALGHFRGKQTQVPPLYSALKMNGKPLYEYAREGKAIPREIESREVEVTELEIIEWYDPGEHNHRWPLEEAEAAERNLAEQVWRVKKTQEGSKPLTPDQKKEDEDAIAEHELQKRKFEERQDRLVRDEPSKRQRQPKNSAMMSGALGSLPGATALHSNRGRDLHVPPPDASTPPPWTDAGPPACKIRMTVSSGYYVRSFCHDLGAKLDSAAIMAELCRTRQSDFTVGGVNCLEYTDLARGEDVWGPRVADMLAKWNADPGSQWQPEQKKQNGQPQRPQIRMPAKPAPQPQEITRKRPLEEPEAMSPPRKVADRRESNAESEESWAGIPN